MYLIKGINHLRCVGVWDEPGGKAEDFNPENAGGYRSPQTTEERRACVARALEYYNSCPPSGEFGLEPITAEQAGLLGEASAEATLLGMEFEDWLVAHSRHCRYCGHIFIPSSPRQDVCKRADCQRKRKNEKAANFYKRKKQNPA